MTFDASQKEDEQLNKEVLDEMREQYRKRVRNIIVLGVTSIVLLAIILKP